MIAIASIEGIDDAAHDGMELILRKFFPLDEQFE
jgi:hypothetical protein